MTTQNLIVESLREKAANDPVSSAVLHMWALRKRARNEVTLNGLSARMKKEGFTHSKQEYEPLLRLMARLGLGRLYTNGKGHVVALKDVDTTLQSIGQAVCNEKSKEPLKRFRKKTQFKPIRAKRLSLSGHKDTERTQGPTQVKPPGAITIELGNKSVTFLLPEGEVDAVISIIDRSRKFLASL